jgi:hypothetical protein
LEVNAGAAVTHAAISAPDPQHISNGGCGLGRERLSLRFHLACFPSTARPYWPVSPSSGHIQCWWRLPSGCPALYAGRKPSGAGMQFRIRGESQRRSQSSMPPRRDQSSVPTPLRWR